MTPNTPTLRKSNVNVRIPTTSFPLFLSNQALILSKNLKLLGLFLLILLLSSLSLHTYTHTHTHSLSLSLFNHLSQSSSSPILLSSLSFSQSFFFSSLSLSLSFSLSPLYISLNPSLLHQCHSFLLLPLLLPLLLLPSLVCGTTSYVHSSIIVGLI